MVHETIHTLAVKSANAIASVCNLPTIERLEDIVPVDEEILGKLKQLYNAVYVGIDFKFDHKHSFHFSIEPKSSPDDTVKHFLMAFVECLRQNNLHPAAIDSINAQHFNNERRDRSKDVDIIARVCVQFTLHCLIHL